jgi:hypothetical protein
VSKYLLIGIENGAPANVFLAEDKEHMLMELSRLFQAEPEIDLDRFFFCELENQSINRWRYNFSSVQDEIELEEILEA